MTRASVRPSRTAKKDAIGNVERIFPLDRKTPRDPLLVGANDIAGVKDSSSVLLHAAFSNPQTRLEVQALTQSDRILTTDLYRGAACGSCRTTLLARMGTKQRKPFSGPDGFSFLSAFPMPSSLIAHPRSDGTFSRDRYANLAGDQDLIVQPRPAFTTPTIACIAICARVCGAYRGKRRRPF